MSGENKSERLIILQTISTLWTSFDMKTVKNIRSTLIYCTWQVKLEGYGFEISNYIFQRKFKNNDIAEGINLNA